MYQELTRRQSAKQFTHISPFNLPSSPVRWGQSFIPISQMQKLMSSYLSQMTQLSGKVVTGAQTVCLRSHSLHYNYGENRGRADEPSCGLISRNLGSILVSESHYTFLSLSLYRCKMGIIAACPSQGCSEDLKRHRKGSEQRQTRRIWLLLLRGCLRNSPARRSSLRSSDST